MDSIEDVHDIFVMGRPGRQVPLLDDLYVEQNRLLGEMVAAEASDPPERTTVCFRNVLLYTALTCTKAAFCPFPLLGHPDEFIHAICPRKYPVRTEALQLSA